MSIRPTSAQTDAQRRAGGQPDGSLGRRQPGRNGRLDWPASLRHGRPRQRSDLCYQPRSDSSSKLWLVVLDCSASTRRQRALSQAKGLLVELFRQIYRQRGRLALLAVGGHQPKWLWPGRRMAQALLEQLTALGAGGGTPLIAALQETAQWLQRRQRQHPAEQQRLLILTDGRLRNWAPLPPSHCLTLLIDMECTPVRLGCGRRLAEQLAATYQHLDQLTVLASAGGAPAHEAHFDYRHWGG